MNVFLAPNLCSSRGGPSTFQRRLIAYFAAHNINHTFAINDNIKAAIIINGTRNIFALLLLSFRRVPIIVRLGSRYRSTLYEKKGIIHEVAYYPKHLLVICAMLLSKCIVFQSNTVKDEWKTHWLMRFKKYRTIYNPVAASIVPVLKHSDILTHEIATQSTCINLISVEANHPSPANSLPLLLHSYLNSIGVCTTLHVFGQVPNSWKFRIPDSKTVLYGFVEQEYLYTLLCQIHRPIYIPSDVFPCGCPNSMIEMLSIGVPSITYSNTAGAELIELCKGGLLLPMLKFSKRRLRYDHLDLSRRHIESILSSYILFSRNAATISNALSPDSIFYQYIDLLANLGKA